MKPTIASLPSKASKGSASSNLPEDQQALVPVLDESDITIPGAHAMIVIQDKSSSQHDKEQQFLSKRNPQKENKTNVRGNCCFHYGLLILGVTTLILLAAGWFFSGIRMHVTFFQQDFVSGKESSRIDSTRLAPYLPAVKCSQQCIFSIVESIPHNLTFDSGEPVHMSTYAGLKRLLSLATKSVRIASYYWTLRGSDVSFHDSTANEGEDIFNTLLALGKSGKVLLQIAQNQDNEDTQILAEQGKAEVRTLNFTRLIGAGILHTKFWIIDDEHFYVGSSNLDWRSLTQVKELGVLVQNCSCLGKDLRKIFDVYWYLGQTSASVPSKWPSNYNTDIDAQNPAKVDFNNTDALVYMSSSPPQFCPSGRTTDIDAILQVISQAEQFINIAVMDYSPSTLYNHPNKYWPIIDDALRKAAFDRRVTVRLLASKWAHTMKDMYAFLCSLSMLGHLKYPKTKLEVKLFEVPVYSTNQSKIPYARVNHNKYMVTDQYAYIGTSNWSGDYFISTGGVGFIVKQPVNSSNATQGNFRQQLYDIFMRDWNSNYTHDLPCDYYNFSNIHAHV